MPRVLILDNIESLAADLLKSAGIEADVRGKLPIEELKAALRQSDAVMVRSATKITADLLEDPGQLRAIARAGAGTDTIDVAAATRQGILVMNTPGGNTVSAAEHTIALMLSLARHVPAGDASMRAGRWERNKFLGVQLAGKTLGIIGLGRIGQEVARRAIGLEMKVIGFDPFLSPDRANQLGIEVASLDDLLPRCDFLTVHTPLTDATRSLIGAKQLAQLKPSCRLLNVARGGIIDEAALAEALKAGRVAGAGIDVFEPEPPPANHPLVTAPNVVLTPHLGASTIEAQEGVAREAAELLINFLTRGVVQYAVNAAAVDRSDLDELRPLAELAWRLGILHAQMDTGAIQRVDLTFRGEALQKGTRLLTASFAAGLLSNWLHGPVNVVNAEVLARERGIELVASSSTKKGDFSTLIQADVSTDKKTYTAAGTLFGNRHLRLVQLGPYRLDTYLDGVLLVFTHQDVPGLIGHIGTIFGKHGVNIAQMAVGRQQPGGEAIAVLNLDSPPREEALSEAIHHERISSARVVKLPPAGEVPAWLA